MLTEKAKEILKGVESKMADTVDFLEEDLKTYRVGKANPSILNNVTVNYYGTDTPVSQVASVSVPDARTITIQPWERSLIPAIEKAIMAANLGFTPQNNGEIIRCPIPPLTEDRRKELTKVAKKFTEESKIAMRNIRRDVNDSLKKLEKNKALSEDELKKAMDDAQKLTDAFVAKCDAKASQKEKEIMEI